jgi:hypothetical protein
MQSAGYMMINGEKVLVLMRPAGKGRGWKTGAWFGRSFKIRKSGGDGTHFSDDEVYLNEHPEIVEQLKAGKVIRV